MLSCLILMGNLVFAQDRFANDPSYSANNYKHPNKASYARKHNLDKSTKLEVVEVNDNSDYKHPYNNSTKTTKAVLLANKGDNKSRKSYKHPFGL